MILRYVVTYEMCCVAVIAIPLNIPNMVVDELYRKHFYRRVFSEHLLFVCLFIYVSYIIKYILNIFY